MPNRNLGPQTRGELRSSAVMRLSAQAGPQGARASASEALGVLHELASSPESAADALALLHELQVHQVELDLQDEELRQSRIELETALRRQIQLYDALPVGCFTVERDTTVSELNLTGAHMLGLACEAVVGQRLERFVAPPSRPALNGLLKRVAENRRGEGCQLTLAAPGSATAGASRTVLAHAGPAPAGPGFVIVFADAL